MSKNNNLCQFYLMRHGQTKWNQEHRIQGQQDSPLTELAIKQAQARSQELQDINFTAVFSSDLSRAQKTAEIMALNHEITVISSKLLRERALGIFEGKKVDDFNEELKALLKTLDTKSHQEFPKYAGAVESVSQVLTRFIRFLRSTALAYPEKKVLVVSHAGVIGNFLVKLGYLDISSMFELKIENLSYAIVESDGVDFFIKNTDGICLRENSDQ